MQEVDVELVERLKSLVRTESADVVREELAGIRIEDLADAVARLSEDEGVALLTLMDDEPAANLLVELPTQTARRLAKHMPDSTLALYLDVLDMDDAIDLREELGVDRFDALLEVIPREDAQEIRRLLAYPEDSVGRLMTERFFEVTPDTTMIEVLADIRKASESKYETMNDIYVLDESRHLVGLFSLRRALRTDPGTLARDIMRTDFVAARARDSAEDAARTMARYGFYALPVLDEHGHMLGIFTGDDAQEVLREAETEDILALGAVTGTVDSYIALNALQLVRRRLPWLFILFVAETFTGTVLRHYVGHETASAATTERLTLIAQLSVFIPLLIGAGGNSGSQVTTTITRALAVGEVRPADFFLVFRREFGVSVVIGLVMGLAGYLRAAFGWHSGFEISLIVGLTLPAIILWATIIGASLPLAAKRVGIDPAVMSAPFITTFVDATGLIIYFEIAQLVLGRTLTG